jgi:hypothetical protein
MSANQFRTSPVARLASWLAGFRVKPSLPSYIGRNPYRRVYLDDLLGPFVVVALVAILVGARCLIGFTCPNDAARTLRSSGYGQVELDGWAGPFACGKGDTYANSFTAQNPRGDQVSGVVCCGIFKGCTVRF